MFVRRPIRQSKPKPMPGVVKQTSVKPSPTCIPQRRQSSPLRSLTPQPRRRATLALLPVHSPPSPSGNVSCPSGDTQVSPSIGRRAHSSSRLDVGVVHPISPVTRPAFGHYRSCEDFTNRQPSPKGSPRPVLSNVRELRDMAAGTRGREGGFPSPPDCSRRSSDTEGERRRRLELSEYLNKDRVGRTRSDPADKHQYRKIYPHQDNVITESVPDVASSWTHRHRRHHSSSGGEGQRGSYRGFKDGAGGDHEHTRHKSVSPRRSLPTPPTDSCNTMLHSRHAIPGSHLSHTLYLGQNYLLASSLLTSDVGM